MILTPSPKQQFFGNNGRPLDGGLLFTYAAGTNNKIDTYQNESGTPNTNPIVLDFRGEANIWLEASQTYKFVLAPRGDTDPPTNPIWSVDNIPGVMSQEDFDDLLAQSPPFATTARETAAGVTVVDHFYPLGDVRRYGAVGNGSIIGQTGTDDSAAFVAANATGYQVLVQGGLIYRISNNVTITSEFFIGPNSTVSVDGGRTLALQGQIQVVSEVPFYGYGYTSFSSAARRGRLVNILPDRAAGVPVHGSGQYFAFGDSYTAGTGVGVDARFTTLLAKRFNLEQHNHAVGGIGVTRTLYECYQNTAAYGLRGQFISWMAGFNDLHYQGGNPKTLVKIASETQAFIANAFLRFAVPASDASVTKTGSWANATPGTWGDKSSAALGGNAMFTGTSGDSIEYTFEGSSIVVAYYQNGGASPYTLTPFEVYIDSVLVEIVSPDDTTDGNAGFPDTYEGMTHAVLVYFGLGGGSHTIEIVAQTANLLAIDYFGTLANPGDCPSLIMGEVCHVNQAGYAGPESLRTKQIDDAASAQIADQVDTFASYGYPVAFVPCNDYYDYQANIQPDDDHPDVEGHRQLAQAFSSYCLPVVAVAFPSASFLKASPQTVPTATTQAVTFSSVVNDLFGFWNVSAPSRIVSIFKGTFRLSGQIVWEDSAAGFIRIIELYKNGVLVRAIDSRAPCTNGVCAQSFSVDVDLIPGDYVQIAATQDSGGDLDIVEDTQVDVMVIR
jgi:hypothetical protein